MRTTWGHECRRPFDPVDNALLRLNCRVAVATRWAAQHRGGPGTPRTRTQSPVPCNIRSARRRACRRPKIAAQFEDYADYRARERDAQRWLILGERHRRTGRLQRLVGKAQHAEHQPPILRRDNPGFLAMTLDTCAQQQVRTPRYTCRTPRLIAGIRPGSFAWSPGLSAQVIAFRRIVTLAVRPVFRRVGDFDFGRLGHRSSSKARGRT